VTRYSFFVSEDTHGPYVEDQEDPDGQWVKYTDIEAMLIEQGLRDFKIATHPSFGTPDEPRVTLPCKHMLPGVLYNLPCQQCAAENRRGES
jgi:hypothetical protein